MLFIISFCRSRLSAYFVFAIAALLLQPGCDTAPPSPAVPKIDASPQAKFDRVVAELRRRLASGTDSGGGRYTISDPYGTLSMVTSYDVKAPEKITMPSKPGQLPHARIKVIRESTSVSLGSADDDKSGDSSDDDEKVESPPIQPQDLASMGYEVLDPEMVHEDIVNATSPRVRVPDFSSRQISSNTETVYDLVFENNRWRMAGPPSGDAPESTNDALDVALKRQK